MVAELHVILYCKHDKGNVVFARAYKYLDKPKNKTAWSRHLLYSYKAKRYVLSDIYVLDWSGFSIPSMVIDPKILRQTLVRIGIDVR